MTPYDLDLGLKVLVAALLGALIGYERERYRKPAGIRTQILICVGSALLAGISIHMGAKFGTPGSLMQPDPARLMAQIVTGIGFLGAGVILKGASHISGVTTAATIWITAAVGIAVGTGFYLVATICALLVLLLHPLARFKNKAISQRVSYTISIHKDDWQEAVRIAERTNADYKLLSVGPKQSRVKFYSSQDDKELVAQKLAAKKISFEMEESH